jgi:hypothetical protein
MKITVVGAVLIVAAALVAGFLLYALNNNRGLNNQQNEG